MSTEGAVNDEGPDQSQPLEEVAGPPVTLDSGAQSAEPIRCLHCRRPVGRTPGSHGYWFHLGGGLACEPERGVTGTTAVPTFGGDSASLP